MVPQRQASSIKVHFKYSSSNILSEPSISRATEVSHRFTTDLSCNENLSRKGASACALPTDDRMQQLLQKTSGSLLTMQETLQKFTSDSLAMQQSLTKIDDNLESLKMLEPPI